VHPEEVDSLRKQLRDVAAGKKFLLQGGDCAERFLDCNQVAIEKKLKIMLQMSLIISWSTGMQCCRIGRIAGQYAKPRSSDIETLKSGKKVFSFRGDCINCIEPDMREPAPERLVQSYFHSSATLNYIRSLLASGFADLHRSEDWDLAYVRDLSLRPKYEKIVQSLLSTLRFMDATCGGMPREGGSVDFFTSHEALFLPYEAALTREGTDGRMYNTSAHMLWIGDRTRQLDGAHISSCVASRTPSA
jgi:3-deoxy-7-phosphoheptulonate synthase